MAASLGAFHRVPLTRWSASCSVRALLATRETEDDDAFAYESDGMYGAGLGIGACGAGSETDLGVPDLQETQDTSGETAAETVAETTAETTPTETVEETAQEVVAQGRLQDDVTDLLPLAVACHNCQSPGGGPRASSIGSSTRPSRARRLPEKSTRTSHEVPPARWRRSGGAHPHPWWLDAGQRRIAERSPRCQVPRRRRAGVDQQWIDDGTSGKHNLAAGAPGSNENRRRAYAGGERGGLLQSERPRTSTSAATTASSAPGGTARRDAARASDRANRSRPAADQRA